jgi:ring-1,2-phenylacetyl-CoA epoxidase subunit PaaC
MNNELVTQAATPASSSIAHRSSLREHLLALADDEFVIGYANSEWTGIAPVLEEDIAFSSLAQDELGHARLLYELLAEIEGRDIDQLVYSRASSDFRNAQLAERPRGDWAYSVSRQFLYDTADYLRLDSLRQSAYSPLASAAASIIREEKYHLLHAQTWLERLAAGGSEARRRQHTAFRARGPDALGLFEPLACESELVTAKMLPDSFANLQQRWLGSIAAPLRRLDLPFPFVECGTAWEAQINPIYGGRRGEHSDHFVELHNNITSVYRLDPCAKW